jgi:hypothetical protein
VLYPSRDEGSRCRGDTLGSVSIADQSLDPELEFFPSGSRLAYGYLDTHPQCGQVSAAEMNARLRVASPAYAAARRAAAR